MADYQAILNAMGWDEKNTPIEEVEEVEEEPQEEDELNDN